VEGWLGGQAGGGALADVLTGRVNPSGKLSETFPVDLQQTPTFPHFPGRAGHASYGEGVFVGYRYYDARRSEPLFPFGFGLSYTRFSYTGIRASATRFDADVPGAVTIEVDVRNIGPVDGQEVVQLYVHEVAPRVPRPPVELRAFGKVALSAGESKTLHFQLTRRDFAYYDTELRAWAVNAGAFDVRVGGSSRDLPLSLTLAVSARQSVMNFSRQSLVRDFKGTLGLYELLLRALGFGELLEDETAGLQDNLPVEELASRRKARRAHLAFADEMPINKVPAFSLGRFDEAWIDELIRLATQASSARGAATAKTSGATPDVKADPSA
jgi:beta-glucosidase